MNEAIAYRPLCREELCQALFAQFTRRQVVTDCWRREGERWVIKSDPFVDDWSTADYQTLVDCLQRTLALGGWVYGAFCGGSLKGFASVEAARFGSQGQYLDLTSLHVSAELRGQGIGSALFGAAKAWARSQGAKKLYISSHSAVETQAFYRAMGCVDAEEYQPVHTEAEPFDRQLECLL